MVSNVNHALPFLRWAGSKRQLLTELESYWFASHTRYVEPFVGSACLFFRLSPPKALLGDLNPELIETYQQVTRGPEEVINALQSYRNNRRFYLKIRSQNPHDLAPIDRAARFIYLNRFCFNGLYRTNRKGHFNVPYGGHATGSLPTLHQLKQCSEALKMAELVCGDFEKVLERATSGDFVYMDPPFSVKARRVFNEYNPSAFSENDVIRLKNWMDRLASNNISFLVSYADSDEARFLTKGFAFTEVSVRRNIAGFTQRRTRASELLIINRGYSCLGKRALTQSQTRL